jgi:DNA-binding response OmpR family regulator
MTAKGTILIVDDEADMRRLVADILARDGYRWVEAEDGSTMRRVLREQRVDLIILDLMLPGEDGLSLAREVRAGSQIPIVMLSARDDVVDKIVGLELGADDYLTKPFHPRELIARIRSVLRRATNSQQAEGANTRAENMVVGFNGWLLDLGEHRLTSPEGHEVRLTTFEFKVLSFLSQRPKTVVSRDEILSFAAKRGWNPLDRSVDVVIGKLRKKFNDSASQPHFIRTVRNAGYMFLPEVSAND